MDHEEKKRKKLAREPHLRAEKAQSLHGIKAKLYNKQRYKEKVQIKKAIKASE